MSIEKANLDEAEKPTELLLTDVSKVEITPEFLRRFVEEVKVAYEEDQYYFRAYGLLLKSADLIAELKKLNEQQVNEITNLNAEIDGYRIDDEEDKDCGDK